MDRKKETIGEMEYMCVTLKKLHAPKNLGKKTILKIFNLLYNFLLVLYLFLENNDKVKNKL